MSKPKPIDDIWWGVALDHECGVMTCLDVTRKNSIELLEKRTGRSWEELRKQGWRAVKLQVREIARS